MREQNLHGSAQDFPLASLFASPQPSRSLWALSPTPMEGSRVGLWIKSTDVNLIPSDRGDRKGEWKHLRPPGNRREFDKAVCMSLSQAAIRRVLAFKKRAAMLSYWPGAPVERMASVHGDGFQSAAAGLWAIAFPERGGLWGTRLQLPHLKSSPPGQLLFILQVLV